MKTTTNLRVGIDVQAMERIWHWTDLAQGEFSCLAEVSDAFVVHDVRLLPQVCTASSTDLDQAAIAAFLCTHPAPERVRAWIHSHGRLATFWSAQDELCIEGLSGPAFLVSIVVNKQRSMRCRVDLWQPLRVTLDDVPLDVRAPNLDLQQQCTEEFRALVTEVEPQRLLRRPSEFYGLGIAEDEDDHPMAPWPRRRRP